MALVLLLGGNVAFASTSTQALAINTGGTVLTAGVILTTRIQTGDFVLINLATTVGHDVNIGNFCSIMPGCSISGSVSLGEVNHEARSINTSVQLQGTCKSPK